MGVDFEGFLKELSVLTNKYRIEIGGCGCCGSPWLADKDYINKEKLEYDEEKKIYTVDGAR